MASLKELKERFKTASSFSQIDESKINYLNPPFAIRNDCQIGQWKLGDSDLIGNSIEVSILQVKFAEGKLGKTTGSWLQVWFVASPNEKKLPQNIVCVTYLKSRSSSAFSNKLVSLLGNKDCPPDLGFWQFGFEKHSGESGLYYSVKPDWSPADEKEAAFLAMVADFNEQKLYLHDSNAPDTLVILESNSQEEIKAAKAIVAELSAA